MQHGNPLRATIGSSCWSFKSVTRDYSSMPHVDAGDYKHSFIVWYHQGNVSNPGEPLWLMLLLLLLLLACCAVFHCIMCVVVCRLVSCVVAAERGDGTALSAR